MTVVAAIDCGTNSTRVLVTDGERELAADLVVTDLGRGVDRSRMLSREGIERTVAVLRDYRALLDRHGVERVRAVATSAARDAHNRDEFFTAALAALGHPLELLDGEEEGRLAFAGATMGLDPAGGPFLVVDLGGGSCEFVVGTDRATASVSVEIGSRRLTEQFLHHDPPAPEELSNAIGYVQDRLEDVLREVPEVADHRTLIGVAGTITTMAAVELGLTEYHRMALHHVRLTRDAAEDVFRTLATEPLADRVHNPGLPPERADVIVGGCCAVVAIMRKLRADELLVSETDLLHGIAASLLGNGAA